MSADKPDPRLRTPMHWTRGRAVGFTTGVPWEPLRPDSLTANVEVQEQDPGSLLNLHRRLIHLRAANSALGSGVLLPLTAANGSVAAYLRRDGDRAVLVVANVGQGPVSSITLASADSVLATGEYVTRDLLTGATGSPLRVGADGRLSTGAPVASLGAMESRIFELTKR